MTITRRIAARTCISLAVLVMAILYIIACIIAPEGK